ncbi:uncharacterized protein LOC101849772 [Aplysia californica]|uniref:Uncharacterized protein LOC101849772 n=1 Tax=Aplysia californica TaxID=6500 RepID=A0ABM0JSC4_APLCA|nr:uncharacterized protein LOC101849772 [Aplysia californica]
MESSGRRRRPNPNEDDFDSWDPMSGDYDNPDFNRYSQGVGRDLVSSNAKGGVKLYAAGIPLDLGQDGFFNLFAEYGNVLDAKLHSGQENQRLGYGFVTMETAIEAELAIRKLHKKKIGSSVLKVAPALTQEEKQRRKKQHQVEADFMTAVHQQRQDAASQSGYVSGAEGKKTGSGSGPPFHRGRGQGLLGAVPEGYDPRGRGSGFPGMQSVWYPLGQQIWKRVPEQQPFRPGVGRGQGFQPAPKSGHVQAKKTCLCCRAEGSAFRCGGCKMYYCSEKCQKKDWPNHRTICQVVQEYLDENLPNRKQQDSASNTNEADSPKKKEAKANATSSKGAQKGSLDDGYESDRKKAVNAKGKKFDEREQNKDQKNAKSGKKPQSDQGGTEPQKSKKEVAVRQNAGGKQTGGSSASDQVKVTDEVPSNVNEAEAGDASSNLVEITVPEDSCGKCLMTYYESPAKFWMSLEESLAEFAEFCTLLHELLNDASVQPPERVKAGDMVGAKYMEEWCRARVVAVKGNSVTIFFVDVGSQDTVERQNLRPLSADMLLIPAQVLCCCISQLKPVGSGSWSEAANTFVKEWFGEAMTKMFKYTMVTRRGSRFAMNLSCNGESLSDVLVSRGFAERVISEPSLPSLRQGTEKPAAASRRMVGDMKSVADDIKVGSEVFCLLTEVQSPVNIWAQPVTEDVLSTVQKLETLLKEAALDTEPYRPVVGELVLGKFSADGSWYRAEVEAEKSGKFSLVFVDYGNKEECTIEDIRKAKDTFLKDCPAQAVKFAFHNVSIPSNVDAAVAHQEFQSLLEEYKISPAMMSVKQKSGSQLVIDITNNTTGEALSQVFQKRVASLPRSSPSAETASAHRQATAASNKSPLSPATSSKSSSPKTGMDFRQPGASLMTSPVAGSRGTTSGTGGEVSSSSPSSLGPEATSSPVVMSVEVLPGMAAGDVKVVVTFFQGCTEFYVRLSSRDKEYIDMMLKLNKTVASKPALKKVYPGMNVAALFDFDETWYRARVDNVEGESARVFFLDFGNSESVDCSQLRALPPALQSLPAQAIRCSIEDVPDCPPKTMQEFKEWFEYQTVLVKRLSADTECTSVPVDAFKLDGTDISLLLKTEARKALKRKEVRAQMESVQGRKIANFVMEKNKPIEAVCVFVVSPLEFYVQIMSHVTEARNITLALKTHIDSNPRPVTSVKVGDSVASKFSQDEEIIWYRCRVEKVTGDTCVLFFVDYGNFEECNISDLMQLRAEDVEMPACTVKCCLRGCTKDNAVTDNIHSLSEMDQVVVLDQNEDICTVDILDSQGHSLTDQFIKAPVPEIPSSKLAALSISSPKQSSVPEPPLSATRRLSTEYLPDSGEAVPVMVTSVESCSELYVVGTLHVAEQLELMQALNEVGDSLPSLPRPGAGALCAARFSKDQSWYRAYVEVMRGVDKCVVQFVDYGNSEETSVADLRELDPLLTELPAQAIRCCLEGHEKGLSEKKALDPDFLQHLQGELLEKPVTVQVVEHRAGVYIVRMENEHGECISGKFAPDPDPAAPAAIPMVDDLIFEMPSDRQFDAHICTLDSLADFYCMRIEDLSRVVALSEQLRQAVDSGAQAGCPKPVVGGVYACQYEGTWYRCQVCEVKGSIVSVKYVDFGNSEERSSEDLRMLSPELMSLPVYLIRCKLYGVEPAEDLSWTSEDLLAYGSMLRNQSIHLHVKGEESDRQLVSVTVPQEDGALDIASDLVSIQVARYVDKSQDRSRNPPASPPRAGASDTVSVVQGQMEEEEDEDEMELQRQIAELQRKLKMKKGLAS